MDSKERWHFNAQEEKEEHDTEDGGTEVHEGVCVRSVPWQAGKAGSGVHF